MHCIATRVKEVKILTVMSHWTIGHTVFAVFERVYQGEGVTTICTVVTTVIGDQIVTVVNSQDIDYKWLVEGQSTTKLSVKTQEIGHVHITCGTSDSDRGPMWL